MIPLHNIEVEQAVINGMVSNKDFRTECFARLTEESFFNMHTRTIFSALEHKEKEDKPIDIPIISGEYVGEHYEKIFSNPANESMLEIYIEELTDKWKLRQLSGMTLDITNAMQLEIDTDEKIDLVSRRIFEISSINLGIDVIPTSEALLRFKAVTDKGYPTGLKGLDDIIQGIKKKRLTIIAGRPGFGKSCMAIEFLTKCARREGKTVALFTLEMPAEEVVGRIVSNLSAIPIYKIERKLVTVGDKETLDKVEEIIIDLPFVINDEVTDFTKIIAIIRRLKNKYKEDFIGCAIDYLQLINLPRSGENRNLEIGYMTSRLKAISKELDIFVILLSQLSRAGDKRDLEFRKPLLSDLRESGSIEQDADLVLFLYYEYYYTKNENKKNLTEIIVGKQRGGPIGEVGVEFKKDIQRFVDIESLPF